VEEICTTELLIVWKVCSSSWGEGEIPPEEALGRFAEEGVLCRDLICLVELISGVM
jgi:hypothetical protein